MARTMNGFLGNLGFRLAQTEAKLFIAKHDSDSNARFRLHAELSLLEQLIKELPNEERALVDKSHKDWAGTMKAISELKTNPNERGNKQ